MKEMKQIEKTITKIVYVADDGTEFDDTWGCEYYEECIFLETIHALGIEFMPATDVGNIAIFTISNKDQIKTLKKYSEYDEELTARLKFVTDVGIYVLKENDDGDLCFYKYPENF